MNIRFPRHLKELAARSWWIISYRIVKENQTFVTKLYEDRKRW